MNALIRSLTETIPFLIWVVIWSLGGIWLIKAAFRLNRYEEFISGVAVGLVLETWLFNLAGRFLPVEVALWVCAMVVILGGFLSLYLNNGRSLKAHRDFEIPFGQLLAFVLLGYVFFRMASGMAIYDDFKTLPMTTMVAIGEVPPSFPFNPTIQLDEHYFYYLIAGQFMLVGKFFTWTALNIVRSLAMCLLLFQVGYLTMRITRSRLASIFSGVFLLLSGGIRWLLLLLPSQAITFINNAIKLSGSGNDSGATLNEALINPWAAQGMGPVTFPFTFVSGFNQAMILALYNDTISPLIMTSMLLFAQRWKNKLSVGLSLILLAAMGLVNEILSMYVTAGIVGWIIVSWVSEKKIRLNYKRGAWILIALGSFLIALVQGGVLNSLLTQFVQKVIFPTANQVQTTYHNFSFAFVFPPTASTSHFGRLSLLNPIQLLLFLIEAGPILFLLPLAFPYLIKAICANRWLEAGFFSTIGFSFIMFFFLVTATRVDSAFNRAQSVFILVLKIFGVALVWMVLPKLRDIQKGILIALFAASMLSGIMIFGIQMVGMQKPVLSLFITELDAKIMSSYWGKLDKNYMVFDPNVPRGVTVFGKANVSSIDFYERTPQWKALTANPDPYAAVTQGYGYLYYDDAYVRSLELPARDLLKNSCMVLMEDLSDWRWGDRWLYDIRGCVK